MSLPFSGFSDIIFRFAADRVIIPSFLLYTRSSSSVALGEEDLGEDIVLSSLDSTLLTSLLYGCDMVAFQISISLDTAFHLFSRASNYIYLLNSHLETLIESLGILSHYMIIKLKTLFLKRNEYTLRENYHFRVNLQRNASRKTVVVRCLFVDMCLPPIT